MTVTEIASVIGIGIAGAMIAMATETGEDIERTMQQRCDEDVTRVGRF